MRNLFINTSSANFRIAFLPCMKNHDLYIYISICLLLTECAIYFAILDVGVIVGVLFLFENLQLGNFIFLVVTLSFYHLRDMKSISLLKQNKQISTKMAD